MKLELRSGRRRFSMARSLVSISRFGRTVAKIRLIGGDGWICGKMDCRMTKMCWTGSGERRVTSRRKGMGKAKKRARKARNVARQIIFALFPTKLALRRTSSEWIARNSVEVEFVHSGIAPSTSRLEPFTSPSRTAINAASLSSSSSHISGQAWSAPTLSTQVSSRK